MRTRAIILIATLSLATVGVIGQPVSAGDDIVLSDGTILTTSISANSITIPANSNVYYAASISLSAVQDIKVLGRLEGSADGAGVPYDISITSGRSIEVAGSVISADGAHAPTTNGDADVIGSSGLDGGDASFSWGAIGTFKLNAGSYIKSGRGGDGGNANAISTAASPIEIKATGGNAGAGGDIRFYGTTAIFQGEIRIGNGGHGGDAYVEINENFPHDSGGANATGGVGGPAGFVQLPTGVTLLQLYNLGVAKDAVGGDGGDATSDVRPTIACGVSGYPGTPGSWYGTGNGGEGCDGHWSQNRGVTGGCAANAVVTCLMGGTGGSAGGNGGRGGDGGDGADGQQGSYVDHPGGGNGGRGGAGGDADNTGGRGGNGLVYGGKGGSATGNGGDGGTGGRGGDGGYSHMTSGSVTPTECRTKFPWCWLGVTQYYMCGHIGQGGEGGPRGLATNQGGQPGNSNTGLHGGYGSVSGGQGVPGSSYGAGNYAPLLCPHGNPHVHVS